MAVDDIYTVSLLHFDNNLADESGKTWTAYGGAATSSAQSKFGGSSLYLDGVDDYLAVPNSTDFEFGSGNFTVDWWEYATSSPDGGCIISRDNAQYTPFLFGYAYNGVRRCYMSSTGASWNLASQVSMGSIILNTWVHYAVVRNGDTFYTFQNGTIVSTFTSSAALFASTSALQISRYYSTINGSTYIDELRISKGIARWTSNFTPPTAPYSPFLPPKKSLIHPSLLSTSIGQK